MRIHSAIEIRPHLLHFDVGLIDAPRVIRRFEMGSASLLQFWCIVLHSAVDRGVIDVETALEHHFLQISIAERIAQIPAYAEQNNLSFNMTPFERGGSIHNADSSQQNNPKFTGQASLLQHYLGTVVRCPVCDTALIRIAHAKGRNFLDMRGVRVLQISAKA